MSLPALGPESARQVPVGKAPSADSGIDAAGPVVVVSVAGPLIALGWFDLLPVLGTLFREVQIPEAVVAECMARPGNPDAQRIRHALDSGLLLACTAPPEGPVAPLVEVLHASGRRLSHAAVAHALAALGETA